MSKPKQAAISAEELGWIVGNDVVSMDAFIADERLPPRIRDHLQHLRMEGVAFYDEGDWRLAVERFERLLVECMYYGEKFTSDPEVRRKLKRAKQTKVASGKPRRKDPLRQKILKLMKGQKRTRRPFKEFMGGWGHQPMNGLRLIEVTPGLYEVADEDSVPEASKQYRYKTLTTLYSEA